MTLDSRILLYCGILVSLLGCIQASCSVSFFARSIKYEDAVEIDFYYTGINLFSAQDCASFCGRREFCRSAVYNTQTKTCGISYEYTLSCAAHSERFTEFRPSSIENGDLIQIACIDECKNGNFKEEGIAKVPIGIITGEPNDGAPRNLARDAINSNVITDPLTTREPEPRKEEGYMTRLILANISGLQEGVVGTVEPLALPQKDDKINKQPKKGKSQICYRTIRHRYLLGANFEEHDVSSINECRCMCAATYKDIKGMHKCQSFQYKAGKCILNKGNHLGHFDLIEERKMVYQFVDCDINVLLDVASNFCPNFNQSKMMATTTLKPTTPKKKIELITAKSIPSIAETENNKKKGKKVVKSKPSKKKTTTTTTTKPKTEATTVKTTAKPKAKATTAPKKAPTTSPKPTTETTTKTTIKSTPKKITTEAPSTTENPEISNNNQQSRSGSEKEETVDEMKIKKDGCFEIIDDYLMVSVAGGLEHDVSIEECECICANSKSSGKYEFQCRSATYYHVERDCILNLEDRVMKSKLFEKQFVNFNVSYIGITCPVETALKSHSELASNQCKRAEPTTTETPKKKKNGSNSDECYVELNDFVLEGTAIAVETNLSPQQCKCKCAEGEKLYGEECASFLYYYDSNTCLINKQNRFSNPEKFNFVPSINQSRSYFEWTCANKDSPRTKYLSNTCSVAVEEIKGNLLNSEGDPIEVKQDKLKDTIDPDEVQMKRLEEETLLKRIEEVVEETKLNEKEEIKAKKDELLKKLEDLELTTPTESSSENASNESKGEKAVKAKVVSEKNIMKKIMEAEKKLEEAGNEKEDSVSEVSAEESTLSEKEGKEKNVKTKVVSEKNIMAKIMEAEKNLEEVENKKQDSYSEVSAEESKLSEKEGKEKNVKTKVVSEKNIMAKILEAEKKLEEAENKEETLVITTTPKLIINKKKNKNIKEKTVTTNDGKNETAVNTRNLSEKEIDVIINKKIGEEVVTSEETVEESDPNRIKTKKIEEKVLEKIAEMEVKEIIPEAEGPEEEYKEVTPPPKTTQTSRAIKKKTNKYVIPEAEGIDEDITGNIEESLSPELDEEPTTVQLSSTSESPNTKNSAEVKTKASGVKTHKFDEKVDKGMPLPKLSTTSPTTTTTAGYPSAGRCSYSALYQTTFLGRRLLKTVRVKSPADCFAACYALRCRSANLVAQGELHSCELYKDSLIDYRRPDMIGYDAATVYFDGINCDGGQY